MSWRNEPQIAEGMGIHSVANLIRDDGQVLGFVMSLNGNRFTAHSRYRRIGVHIGLAAAQAAVERSLERRACGNDW